MKAQQVRTLIRRDCEAALERADVIAMPTSPVPAFPIGEHVSDPLQMYLTDIFTVTANLAGLPAISIPCGFTKMGCDNLPAHRQSACASNRQRHRGNACKVGRHGEDVAQVHLKRVIGFFAKFEGGRRRRRRGDDVAFFKRLLEVALDEGPNF